MLPIFDAGSGLSSIINGVTGIVFTKWKHTIWFYAANMSLRLHLSIIRKTKTVKMNFSCALSFMFAESKEWLKSKNRAVHSGEIKKFRKSKTGFHLR